MTARESWLKRLVELPCSRVPAPPLIIGSFDFITKRPRHV
jgi:hypothetical protein